MTDEIPEPFWRRLALAEMSPAEWEQLCDGCARCCLIKLEDTETGAVAYTDVACKLLDRETCRCSDYARRSERVPGCVRLDAATLPAIAHWMPPSCAYRRLQEGRDLPAWHPLRTGRAASVEEAGASVKGRTRPERGQRPAALARRIVSWPQDDPA